MKSLSPIKLLRLTFQLPSIRKEYKSKSINVIKHMIERQGKESLLDELKMEGLGTSITVIINASDYYSLLAVQLSLSTEGIENYERAIAITISYFSFLGGDIPDSVFENLRESLRLRFNFSLDMPPIQSNQMF